MCELEVDPKSFDNSDSDEWLTDSENKDFTVLVKKDSIEHSVLDTKHLDYKERLNCISTECICKKNVCQLSRIVPVGSPVLTVYFGKNPVNISIDSGAT